MTHSHWCGVGQFDYYRLWKWGVHNDSIPASKQQWLGQRYEETRRKEERRRRRTPIVTNTKGCIFSMVNQNAITILGSNISVGVMAPTFE